MQHVIVNTETGDAEVVPLTADEKAERVALAKTTTTLEQAETAAVDTRRGELRDAWTAYLAATSLAALKTPLTVILRALIRRVFVLGQDDIS